MSTSTLNKGSIEADLSVITDGDNIVSYLADAAGNFLTSTTVGGDQALDINVVASILAQTEDAVHSSGDIGVMGLAVRNDAGTPLAADGDYIPLTTDSSGNLRVAGSFTVTEEDTYDEDSASTTGDKGTFILSVRRDSAGSNTSADGDYAELQSNAVGEMRFINKVETALENTVELPSSTAAAIGTGLANRKHIMIQNTGTRSVFLGKSDVTADATLATGGLELARGGTFEADLAPGVAIFGRTASGAGEIRILEMS